MKKFPSFAEEVNTAAGDYRMVDLLLTKDAEACIAAFRKHFNLPLYYQTINLESQTLNPPE